MKRLSAFRKMTVAAACCVFAFAACTDDDADDGTTLPDGKYPMAFTAGVDGLAATRATTDNTWTGGEEVAVQIGSEVKKYTAATNNTLSAAEGVTPWYWQNTTETKTVSAWYPYSDTKPAANELKVKADQSGNGYGQSDHLEAAEATVTFRSPALTFKHRTAKVVVTLKGGNGVADVSSATVWFLNQTGVESGGTEITPKTVTTDGTATYTALLIPQQMQKQKFIKVTVGGNDYFYTPTGQNDANLMGGNQYAYDITVTKNGLTVTADGATAWNSSSTTDVTSKTPSQNYSASDLKIGDYYYSDGKWSDGGYRKYDDNTTAILPVMPVLTDADGNLRTVIGIVLKAGRDGVGSNWKDDCDYKLKGTTNPMTDIHGYVLGLYDAKDEHGNTVTLQWGSYHTKVAHADMNREQNTGFYGYKNTNAIKAFAEQNGKTLQADFPATYYATKAYDDSYPAPANSSGWFLPSAGQGKYWLDNRDVILASARKATGNFGYNWQTYYWSSSEYYSNSDIFAWGVNFDIGSVDWDSKEREYCVRGVFAF